MSREVARWTFAHGSRPEGAIEYQDGCLVSHHDTDPARGNNSAWDLVRKHKFSSLDKDCDPSTPIADRPSQKAMIKFAESLPEIRAMRAQNEFEDLGPTSEPAVNDDWFEIGESKPVDTVARFTPRPPGEFTSGPPQDWLIRGVLPQAGLVVIYGESGSGKTFLVLDMVAALTRGVEWNGRRSKKCKVTYIAAEGAGGFKKRMRAYARRHEVSIDVLPWVIADSPYFLNVEHPAAVIKGMKATGQVDVVVIDTCAAVMPGGNENSGEDLGKVVDYCKLIHRETGALVVLIHHSGKDAARGARGWSGLKAAADAEIEVTRKGDDRKFKTSKMKDESDGDIVRFKLERVVLGVNDFDEEESSCVVSFDVKEQRASTNYKPKKPYESGIMDVVNGSTAADFDVKELAVEVLKNIPCETEPGERDQRGRSVQSGIRKLCAEKLLVVVPDTGARRVRKAGPIRTDESCPPYDVVTDLGAAATLASAKGN